MVHYDITSSGGISLFAGVGSHPFHSEHLVKWVSICKGNRRSKIWISYGGKNWNNYRTWNCCGCWQKKWAHNKEKNNKRRARLLTCCFLPAFYRNYQ